MLNFFDTIPLPTIVVNKVNNIIFINQIGLNFFELDFKDINFQPIHYFFPELDLNNLEIKKEFDIYYTNSIGVKQLLKIQFDTCLIENNECKLFYIKQFTKTQKPTIYYQNKHKLIREKLHFFELFLNQINEGVLVFNTTGQLIYINTTVLNHFKLRNTKIKNNFAWDFIEIFDSKTDWETKKTLINEENNIPVFFTKYNNLNKECTFSGFMNLQYLEDKEHYFISYSDVSESVISQKFNDSILFNIPADIAVFDKNHNYLFINPKGIGNEELRNWMIGKDDFDYYKYKNLDTKPAEQRRAYFNQAKETKQQVDWVDEIVKEDKTFYVLRRFYPYYIDDVFVYMIGYGIDITELKRTQTVLSEAQKQNELILKSTLDGVILIDKNWKIIYWNPQAEHIFGWKSDEVLGSYLPNLIFPTDVENNRVFTNTSFINQNTNKTLEFNASNKNGNELTIELSIVTIEEHENTYNSCIFISDISFRKEKENKIAQQNKMLISQNKELEQFTYIASHDLQEPLLSLMSYSKLLEQEYESQLDEEGKMFVQFINKSAVRMRSLISGLMQYARINKRENLIKTDIQFLLQEVQADLSNKIKKYNALITYDNLPSLYCYPTYTRLLFQNLISNAIKFTKPEIQPEIQISYAEREYDWLFQVKDNGIGIDSKNSEQIFLIFKRLHSEQSYMGNGIGLAHCKKIVEIHNGEIWVESSLGQGSIFNFTISKNI